MGAICSWTENMVAEISSMRRNRADSLARLKGQTITTLHDARDKRLETARREGENRRIAVSEIFSNCRGMMEKFRMERQEMAQELHSNFHALRGHLQELKTDFAKARAVWEELSKKNRTTP